MVVDAIGITSISKRLFIGVTLDERVSQKEEKKGPIHVLPIAQNTLCIC